MIRVLAAHQPLLHASPAAAFLYTGLLIALTTGCLLVAVVLAVRRRRPGPLVALVCGAATGLADPFFDEMGHIYWPSNVPLEAFSYLGHRVTWGGVCGYALFFGAVPYGISVMLRKGLLAGPGLWRAVGVVAVLDALVEVPWLNAPLYEYTGYQPYALFGLPLHWLVMIATIPVCCGWLMWVAGRLSAETEALPAVVGAFAAPGLVFVFGFPVFAALNADVPHGLVQLAGAATIVLSLGFLHTIARATPAPRRPGTPDPVSSTGRP